MFNILFNKCFCFIFSVAVRDACQITVLHHEDNGMNIEMAKLAFSKGIWNYICKMNHALRHYPQHHSPSKSILTMQRLIKKVTSHYSFFSSAYSSLI
jgi:hypothetical protein